MITELEKQFYKLFDIPHNMRKHYQYNYAQVEKGLEIFSERKKLEDQGLIKITHSMLNPRPENDCVYWEELHYLEIDYNKLENLLRKKCGFWLEATSNTECYQYTTKCPKYCSNWHKNKNEALLAMYIKIFSYLKSDVQQLFELEN